MKKNETAYEIKNCGAQKSNAPKKTVNKAKPIVRCGNDLRNGK